MNNKGTVRSVLLAESLMQVRVTMTRGTIVQHSSTAKHAPYAEGSTQTQKQKAQLKVEAEARR